MRANVFEDALENVITQLRSIVVAMSLASRLVVLLWWGLIVFVSVVL